MVGYLFDNTGKFGFSVNKAAYKIFAAANKLLKFKLFKGIEFEGTYWLANSYLHVIK